MSKHKKYWFQMNFFDWILQSKGGVLFICGLMMIGWFICIGLILYYGG